MLKIVLKRSFIGVPENQKRVMRALGLRKIGNTVYKDDTPSVKGMIHKISHLIEVEVVKG